MAERQNARPTLNLPPISNIPNYSEPKSVKTKFPVFNGVFTNNSGRPPVNSRNSPGFYNAKFASMLEKGWREMNIDEFDVKVGYGTRKKEAVTPNIIALIEENDGPQYEATLIKFQPVGNSYHRRNDVFTFKTLDPPKEWTVTRNDLLNEGTRVYIKTAPVPFVPRPFVRPYSNENTRRQRKTRRRKQRGGFYPSVYGGVAGATMLTPLVARQMMRMYETSNKTRKSKSKKTLKNKRA